MEVSANTDNKRDSMGGGYLMYLKFQSEQKSNQKIPAKIIPRESCQQNSSSKNYSRGEEYQNIKCVFKIL